MLVELEKCLATFCKRIIEFAKPVAQTEKSTGKVNK
jgi:hypothetical protein